MNIVLYLIIGLILGWVVRGFSEANKTTKERILGPLASFNLKRKKAKQEKKQKILDLLKVKDKITNDDVQELLNVSHPTAVNYLQELVSENKVIQHGEAGRDVFYTRP